MAHPTPLPLDAYRELVALDTPFHPLLPVEDVPPVEELVRSLIAATPDDAWTRDDFPLERMPAREALRAMLTIRLPEPPLPEELHAAMDVLLIGEQRRRQVTEATQLPSLHEMFQLTRYPSAEQCALWHGDITTLRADAIVNAANDALLGCFIPFHACIDNAIHAAAGPRLRKDCGRIMQAQGAPEPTGAAKITRGYHLPAAYVLHTVGPIVRSSLMPAHAAALASCYRSCLDLAAQVAGIRSVAFCAISTGVFGYPKEEAARVALATAGAWLCEHPGALDRVVFNVFSDMDRAVYARLVEGWR